MDADDFFNDHERVNLTLEQIDECKMLIYKNNRLKMVPIERRNIVLCGKSRSGKTTSISVLKDPCAQPSDLKIFADTIHPEYTNFSIQDNTTKGVQRYSLSLIDTPGFYELRPHGVGPRPEEMLIDMIRKCLDYEITNIHNAFIFVHVGETFNKDDFSTLERYLELFSGGNLRMALVITHSEDTDFAWRKNLVDQIKNVDFFQDKLTDDPYRYCDLSVHKELEEELEKLKEQKKLSTEEKEQMEKEESEKDYGKSKLDILFMGCVDPHKKETESGLMHDYKQVYLMRKIFLQYVFLSTHRVQLKNMEVLKGRKAKIISFLQTVIQSFQNLQNQLNFDIVEGPQFNEHRKLMKQVLEYRRFIDIPGVHEEFEKLSKVAKETADILKFHWEKEERIHQLVWPLKIDIQLQA